MGMPIEAVWRRIERRYEELTPQMRKAARYVRGNPQDVALNSLRGLARHADVSPAAMTRLTRALDYPSFDDFQAAHRDWLTRAAPAAFSGKAGEIVAKSRGQGAEDELLDGVVMAEKANIDGALSPTRRDRLRAAADRIIAAPGLGILGIRSCFPVAFSLHYSLSLFLSKARLLSGTGRPVADELDLLAPGDVLVAVTVAPYSRQVVEIVDHAARRGIDVIAITDDHLSPIARAAEIALISENASPSHIASPTAPIAVGQALAMLVLARAGEAGLETMRKREAMLEATDAYLDATGARAG